MRYAILSDVHDRRRNLEAVLANAQSQGAGQIISLGDVGGEGCLDLLRQVGALTVFGNYEVSGWRRLPLSHKSWVEGWPPLLAQDRFMAVNAAPWWPRGLASVADFGDWLKKTGRPWRALFPYLTDDPDYIWKAIVELETEGKAILFHGHTHLQSVWCWEQSSRLHQVQAAEISVQDANHYLVGVGSVGLPEDGCWAAYTIYDSSERSIQQVRLARPRPGKLF